jgi:hypothetical protein
MVRLLAAAAAILSTTACQGALLTNFAGSYWRYQSCTVSLPASKCYKLYCDPQGLFSGQLTAVVDVPEAPGQSRFDLSPENHIEATHPSYTASVGAPLITTASGRERYEAKVQFQLVAVEPPAGEILLFELHVHDALPAIGPAGAEAYFLFEPGDFVTVFDSDAPPATAFTTFNHTQLQDVRLTFVAEPSAATLLACAAAATVAWLRRRR